jgi:hypothetical protein
LSPISEPPKHEADHLIALRWLDPIAVILASVRAEGPLPHALQDQAPQRAAQFEISADRSTSMNTRCRGAPRGGGERMRILLVLTGWIQLIRRFRTFRSIDLFTILLDGWCGRALAASRGKNGTVLHALFAGSITGRIANVSA